MGMAMQRTLPLYVVLLLLDHQIPILAQGRFIGLLTLGKGNIQSECACRCTAEAILQEYEHKDVDRQKQDKKRK